MGSRFWKSRLIAVGVLALGSTEAGAFAISMVARNATTGLDVSDTVTVDVFFDATDVGINVFRASVLVSNSGALHYDAAASLALPASGAAGPGTQPAEILYDPSFGSGMSLVPQVGLYPQQTPAWLTWPAPPPGQQQVAINYAEINIVDTYTTRTTGIGIWIGSLVFHVDAPITWETLSLSMSTPNDVLELGYGEVYVPPEEIGLSAPIVLTGVPEPTTGVLVALGLSLWLGLGWSGRSGSRARRPAA